MADWTEEEIRALCGAYFDMLENERLGLPYVKRDQNAAVQKSTGRSTGAIEYKFGNVSAVLADLGLGWIRGYKPRANYQKLLRDVIERGLSNETARAWNGGEEQIFRPSSELEHSSLRESERGDMHLQQLLKRSFGGGNVAIGQQADAEFWPLAQPAAGAEEASHLFTSELGKSPDELSWLVFLGGPGNGKSELARAIQNSPDLDAVGAAALTGHRRSVQARHKSGRSIRIVNDATIRSDGASLATDFRAALDSSEHLVLNVNRGVLVEDLQSNQSGLIDNFEGWIIRYLLDPEISSDLGGYAIETIGNQKSLYIEQISISSPTALIRLRVVRLDVCSLFEPRPPTRVEGDSLISGSYRVTRLNERLGLDIAEVPALDLVQQTLDELPSGLFMDPRFDVIGANLATLRAPSVLSGVGTVMRAAELVESRLFTFREVWGAISLLILGPSTPDDADLARYLSACQSALEAVQIEDSSPKNRLAALLPLARYRFTQALFSELPLDLFGSGWTLSRMTPVTNRLSSVDPAIDAIPGRGVDLQSGWASPVLDALDEAQFGGSPIDRISANDEKFRAAITPFDLNLEKELLAYCLDPETRDSHQDAAMSWFGRYLLRIYGVVHGIPAFAEPLLWWTRGWNHAQMSGNLGNELGSRVKMLLVPPFAAQHGGGDVLVLPVFAPQTVPLIDGTDAPVAVARFQSNLLSTAASVFGDRLKVGLMFENENILTIDFDFPLLREAMTSEGRYSGATELGARSTPRLERARASLLTSRVLASSWGAANGDSLVSFGLSNGDE